LLTIVVSFVDRDMFSRFLRFQDALGIVDYSNPGRTGRSAAADRDPEDLAAEQQGAATDAANNAGNANQEGGEAGEEDDEADAEAEDEGLLAEAEPDAEAEDGDLDEEFDEVEVAADDDEALGGVWDDIDEDLEDL
jgi:hypothetical protein